MGRDQSRQCPPIHRGVEDFLSPAVGRSGLSDIDVTGSYVWMLMLMRMMTMLVTTEVFTERLPCVKHHFSHLRDEVSEGWEGK